MVDLQRSKTVFLAGLATVALTMVGAPVPASAAPWTERTIVSLDLLPGGTTSRATAVNDRGVIVGYGDTASGENHAVRWSPDGRVTELGALPGSTLSYAYGINDHGDTVGYADTPAGERAVRWAPDGTITDLGTLPGGFNARAYGINDEGSVVGEVPIRSKTFHAVKWRPDGTVIDIGTKSSRSSTSPSAINNHDVAVGRTYSPGGGHYQEAVTWPAGADTFIMLPLLPDGGPRSTAMGVNEKGLIVGYAEVKPSTPQKNPVHATLWSPGASAPLDLGGLPGAGNFSAANDINAANDIVGSSATSTHGERDAVLWKWSSDGWLIESLPQLAGGHESEATAINDLGVVVGEAVTASGQRVAVRWQ
ncbi:hypothetical protein [Actinomadura sp. NEAU-AAG7]|uniref:hypothetical protein n=1 Tax=Actinomadura sp. NEAU-AAG7 TaxID=2839640 RepID=UPI001BE3F1E9|nr:hypothetical protein [Actinomadura sp. NEAU-AAG7]MBT2212372.1 hypothetical protein [Actinomadura sp. NEAU-AAG7]